MPTDQPTNQKPKKGKRWYQNPQIIGIITAVFFLVIILISIGRSNNQSNQSQQVHNQSNQSQPTQQNQEKVKKESPSFSDQEITEENIKKQLPNFQNLVKEIKISDYTTKTDKVSGKTVTIKYKPDAVWDEKHSAKIFARNSIKIGKKLFTNSNLKELTILQYGDFTDKYGKTNEEKAFQIDINRKTADKIDWDGLEELVTLNYKHIFEVADFVYIHPAIAKELNKD